MDVLKEKWNPPAEMMFQIILYISLFQPFGAGLVTVVVPQVRRGENSLYLWSINGQSQMHPIHTFVGHKDVVLEFQWRKQPEGKRINLYSCIERYFLYRSLI